MPSVNISVKVDGLVQTRDALGRFIKRVSVDTEKILAQEAPLADVDAKRMTPFDSGDLERGTTVTYQGHGRITGVSSSIHNGYDYAYVQHEFEFHHPVKGTDHYLAKAFDDMVRRINNRYKGEIKYD